MEDAEFAPAEDQVRSDPPRRLFETVPLGGAVPSPTAHGASPEGAARIPPGEAVVEGHPREANVAPTRLPPFAPSTNVELQDLQGAGSAGAGSALAKDTSGPPAAASTPLGPSESRPMASMPANVPGDPGTPAVRSSLRKRLGSHPPTASPMSRAKRARLVRHGFANAEGDNGRATAPSPLHSPNGTDSPPAAAIPPSPRVGAPTRDKFIKLDNSGIRVCPQVRDPLRCHAHRAINNCASAL